MQLQLEKIFKNQLYFSFIINHLSQLLQSCSIWRFGEPKFEISVAAVFLVKMLHHAVVLLLLGELGIMVEAVLDSAADDGLWVNEAVGFGNDAAVDGARFVLSR